ncbi:transcription initiation protein [Nocardia cyriacigeorgica]|uniref:YciI family protein n=1 Tax=Nocardia cyriacigeorgica TaxID=135487 RepID=UPI001894087A|nr:YciI family protein [Nocardia cyriacigeorgica]MBF6424100.1 transcription initiation protein [Nocardia cyriacigeorgica]
MHYLALLVGREDEPQAQPGSAEFDAEVRLYAEFEERVTGAIAGGAALYPSSAAVNVTRDGDSTLITDGPFAEGAEVVGGFYVFEAADLDEVIGLARQLPAVESGAIELRPLVQWTPHEEPGADWWMALLWDRADAVIAPDTPEWEAALAEHQRFAEKAGAAIRGGGALRPPSSATTLRMRNGELSITDGPFGETAEVVDGLYLFAAPDRRAATEIAAQIPLGAKGRTELRQIVDLGQ